MRFYSYLLLIVSLVLIAACSSTKDAIEEPMPIVEMVQMDTVFVTAEPDPLPEPEIANELPVYRAAAKRMVNLIHTDLDLRFDWSKQHVIGVAQLELTPIFYPVNSVSLDAQNFIINKITDKAGKELTYTYDEQDIVIELGRFVQKGQRIDLVIDYIARPEAGEQGGSAAIAGNKGLFFIDPLDEDPMKPEQIWTQGETEHNSRWFPTIDKPNENSTQEISLTVDNKYRTLSNGLLVTSVNNSDGTRTDTWRQNKPHAPYLFMVAVGEFATVDDRWRNIPLEYIVEKEYKEDAKEIFAHTPEMLSFFSEYTGVDYPWDKYSQIVVRDYVSGAMENTTAVIFGDFVQRHKRELIDDHNDRIVAHEMMHHWFGDYVTCESWSNLTLNEGFANYSEYLWAEHHEGRDAADHHRHNEFQGYAGSAAQQGVHPLIHYGYGEAEEMFDAHSYNKGGLVLHQLRYYIGEDAFKAALKKYLEDNAFSAVEVDELRLAFEDVTGEDLNWFFDQWFLGAGHPLIAVTKEYNAENKTLTLNMSQMQDPETMVSIFQMPLAVDMYLAGGQKVTERILLNQRNQSWTFTVDSEPLLVDIDPSKSALALWNYEKSPEELAFQYQNVSTYAARREAIEGLAQSGYAGATDIFKDALDDPFYFMRGAAVSLLSLADHPDLVEVYKKMATDDPHSEVRAAAIQELARTEDVTLKPVYEKALNDLAYPVVGAAMDAMYSIAPVEALQKADEWSADAPSSLVPFIAGMYAEQGDPKYNDFFRDQLSSMSGYSIFNFMGGYVRHIQGLEEAVALDETKFLVSRAETAGDIYGKLGLMYGLFQLKNAADPENTMGAYLTEEVTRLVSNETNGMLKGYYQQMGG